MSVLRNGFVLYLMEVDEQPRRDNFPENDLHARRGLDDTINPPGDVLSFPINQASVIARRKEVVLLSAVC